MHTRQSGAAHVPIMFFLILLVLFLGTLGFAYVTLTKNGELMQDRDDAIAQAKELTNRALLVEHYIEDLGLVVGKPGEYKGRANRDYDGATLTSPGMMNPAEIKQVMENACSAAGVSVSTSLENVFNSMVTRINQLQDRVTSAEGELAKAIADKNAVDDKFRTATTDATARAREFTQNLDQARAEFEQFRSSQAGTIANLRQNLIDKDNELLQNNETAAATEKGLRGEISLLQNQNSALVSREELRKPADVSDGKIIAARDGVRTAFIGLGKKDLLQPGTMFRIRNPRSDAVKGYAEVIRVEEERAEVKLSGIADPVGDWVRKGDLLYNDLYTPGMSRTIYLMGRFSAPYNKDALSTLLTRLGNKVVTKMAPGVDTVVLGNDPINEDGDGFASIEDSDEYKNAVQWRVEFAPLLKIRDLIAPSK
ncbi:MAG: hypothetical protein KDE27_12200 [Planctomycetes bacterium]|nr:hypothetical protein [Planctomycetota bacterium]